jgi:hypothetical protein
VFAHNFATEIADAKKLQAARIARLAAKAADGASKSVDKAVGAASKAVEDLIEALPIHSLMFPAVCTRLVSDRVLVESWARGVTVSELFPRLEAVSKLDHDAAVEASAASPSASWLEKVATEEDASSTAQITTSQWKRQDAADPRVAEQRRLAAKIADMSFKMFLRDNYVHSDLHAGNLLWDRETDTLTVIDVGLVTKIEKDMAFAFGDFLRALVQLDAPTLANKLMVFHNPGAVAPGAAQPVLQEIVDEMRVTLQPYQVCVDSGGGRRANVAFFSLLCEGFSLGWTNLLFFRVFDHDVYIF